MADGSRSRNSRRPLHAGRRDGGGRVDRLSAMLWQGADSAGNERGRRRESPAGAERLRRNDRSGSVRVRGPSSREIAARGEDAARHRHRQGMDSSRAHRSDRAAFTCRILVIVSRCLCPGTSGGVLHWLAEEAGCRRYDIEHIPTPRAFSRKHEIAPFRVPQFAHGFVWSRSSLSSGEASYGRQEIAAPICHRFSLHRQRIRKAREKAGVCRSFQD